MRLVPALAATCALAAAALLPATASAAPTDHPVLKASKPAKSDVPTLHYKQSKTVAAAECEAGDTSPPSLLASAVTPKALGIGVQEVKTNTFSFVFSDPCDVGGAYIDMERWDGSNPHSFDLYFMEYDANGNEVWAITIEADPYALDNTMAGTWTSTVSPWDNLDNYATYDGPLFYLQRWSRMSNNASPEPVKKGSTVTVSGALTRASWNSLKYYGYASQPVTLAFRTTSGSYSTVKTLKTSSTGTLKTSVTATQDGCFRFEFAGTTTTPAVKGTGDCVDVR